MRIAKKPSKVVASKRVVRADDDITEAPVETPEADVAPEATDLLFETEDVAQLLAEVTNSEVTADVDDDTDAIVFTVNDEEYVVEPEGDEEILEATRRPLRGKKSVKASTRNNRISGVRRSVRRK